ncbi:MAG: glycoside hydrolase, partial [Marmoricola sp.]|nr:glycoside hydrolase [Marmoricola sp.]
MTELVLGPMVRYVDHTSASVWAETSGTDVVTVSVGDRTWSARTFAVHGHHYALVELDGLGPGTVSPYTVALGE